MADYVFTVEGKLDDSKILSQWGEIKEVITGDDLLIHFSGDDKELKKIFNEIKNQDPEATIYFQADQKSMQKLLSGFENKDMFKFDPKKTGLKDAFGKIQEYASTKLRGADLSKYYAEIASAFADPTQSASSLFEMLSKIDTKFKALAKNVTIKDSLRDLTPNDIDRLIEKAEKLEKINQEIYDFESKNKQYRDFYGENKEAQDRADEAAKKILKDRVKEARKRLTIGGDKKLYNNELDEYAKYSEQAQELYDKLKGRSFNVKTLNKAKTNLEDVQQLIAAINKAKNIEDQLKDAGVLKDGSSLLEGLDTSAIMQDMGQKAGTAYINALTAQLKKDKKNLQTEIGDTLSTAAQRNAKGATSRAEKTGEKVAAKKAKGGGGSGSGDGTGEGSGGAVEGVAGAAGEAADGLNNLGQAGQAAGQNIADGINQATEQLDELEGKLTEAKEKLELLRKGDKAVSELDSRDKLGFRTIMKDELKKLDEMMSSGAAQEQLEAQQKKILDLGATFEKAFGESYLNDTLVSEGFKNKYKTLSESFKDKYTPQVLQSINENEIKEQTQIVDELTKKIQDLKQAGAVPEQTGGSGISGMTDDLKQLESELDSAKKKLDELKNVTAETPEIKEILGEMDQLMGKYEKSMQGKADFYEKDFERFATLYSTLQDYSLLGNFDNPSELYKKYGDFFEDLSFAYDEKGEKSFKGLDLFSDKIQQQEAVISDLEGRIAKIKEKGSSASSKTGGADDGNGTTVDGVKQALEDLPDSKDITINVHAEEGLGVIDNVKSSLDSIPEEKIIKIRTTDYDNLPLMSDASGKTVDVFRGTHGVYGFTGENGVSWFTDQLELATQYADTLSEDGKVIKANLSYKNPMEVFGNGADFDKLDLSGVGKEFTEQAQKMGFNVKKMVTDDVVAVAKSIGKDGVIFRDIKDGFDSVARNVFATIDQAQVKNEKLFGTVEKNTGKLIPAVADQAENTLVDINVNTDSLRGQIEAVLSDPFEIDIKPNTDGLKEGIQDAIKSETKSATQKVKHQDRQTKQSASLTDSESYKELKDFSFINDSSILNEPMYDFELQKLIEKGGQLEQILQRVFTENPGSTLQTVIDAVQQELTDTTTEASNFDNILSEIRKGSKKWTFNDLLTDRDGFSKDLNDLSDQLVEIREAGGGDSKEALNLETRIQSMLKAQSKLLDPKYESVRSYYDEIQNKLSQRARTVEDEMWDAMANGGDLTSKNDFADLVSNRLGLDFSKVVSDSNISNLQGLLGILKNIDTIRGRISNNGQMQFYDKQVKENLNLADTLRQRLINTPDNEKQDDPEWVENQYKYIAEHLQKAEEYKKKIADIKGESYEMQNFTAESVKSSMESSGGEIDALEQKTKEIAEEGEAAEKAKQQKEDFAKANEHVSQATDSKPIEEAADKIDDEGESAKKAKKEKEEFAKANEYVADSANETAEETKDAIKDIENEGEAVDKGGWGSDQITELLGNISHLKETIDGISTSFTDFAGSLDVSSAIEGMNSLSSTIDEVKEKIESLTTATEGLDLEGLGKAFGKEEITQSLTNALDKLEEVKGVFSQGFGLGEAGAEAPINNLITAFERLARILEIIQAKGKIDIDLGEGAEQATENLNNDKAKSDTKNKKNIENETGSAMKKVLDEIYKENAEAGITGMTHEQWQRVLAVSGKYKDQLGDIVDVQRSMLDQNDEMSTMYDITTTKGKFRIYDSGAVGDKTKMGDELTRQKEINAQNLKDANSKLKQYENAVEKVATLQSKIASNKIQGKEDFALVGQWEAAKQAAEEAKVEFQSAIDVLEEADKGAFQRKMGELDQTLEHPETTEKYANNEFDAIAKSIQKCYDAAKEFESVREKFDIGQATQRQLDAAAEKMNNSYEAAERGMKRLEEMNEQKTNKHATDETLETGRDMFREVQEIRNGASASGDFGFETEERSWATLIKNADKYAKILQKQKDGQKLNYSDISFLDKYGQKYEEATKKIQETKAAQEDLTESQQRFESKFESAKQNAFENSMQNMENELNKLNDLYLNDDGAQALTTLRKKYDDITKAVKEYGRESKQAQEAIDTYKTANRDFDQTYRAGYYTAASAEDIATTKRRMMEYAQKNTRDTETISWINSIKDSLDGISAGGLSEVNAKLDEFKAKAAEAGNNGKTFGDTLKKSFQGLARYLMTYVGFYEIVNTIKQAVGMVKDLDTALMEVRKVSTEPLSELKEWQKGTFDQADKFGTTAQQIQESTASWLRLGKSFTEAQEAAGASNWLLNVSEFENIDEATTALMSITQAFNDLDYETVIDKLNNVGDHFSSATDQLASGLQNSAAVLKVQGNDIDKSLALLTAGNDITQDMSKTSAGIRTISLRIAGTEEAKNEIADMGEDIDDFVVRTRSKTDKIVRDYTAVASNNYKGVSVLDDNGNLRDTYDILLDIADVYKEIQTTDKKAGTNRAQGLVETLAQTCENIQKYIYRTYLIAGNTLEPFTTITEKSRYDGFTTNGLVVLQRSTVMEIKR